MSIPYTEFNWFYPPRSQMCFPYKNESAILKMWKKFPDARAQFKMNGANDMMVVHPDRTIEHWRRSKLDAQGKTSATGQPKLLDFTMPAALRDEVLSFTPKGSITIYNVELMHGKTPQIKNTLYFFDVLVWDGQYLIGEPYSERYNILENLLGKRYFPLDLTSVDGKLYIAENMEPSQWDDAWQRAKGASYCEGLVLKRHGDVSRLMYGHSEKNNGGFLCRIRKPQKNSRY